ncbi:hypothetical protein KEM54_000664, partial [Ascosphaera aggregata]
MAPGFDELFIDRPSQPSASRNQSHPQPSPFGRRPTLARDGMGMGVAYGDQLTESVHIRNGPRCYASLTDNKGQSTSMYPRPLPGEVPASLPTQTRSPGKPANSSGPPSTRAPNHPAPAPKRNLPCLATTFEPYKANGHRPKGPEPPIMTPNQQTMGQPWSNRHVHIRSSTKSGNRPVAEHSRRNNQHPVKMPMNNGPIFDSAVPPLPPLELPTNLVPGHEKERSASGSTPKRPTTPHVLTPAYRPRQYTINGVQRDRVIEPYTLTANAAPATGYIPFRPPSPLVPLLPMGSPTVGSPQVPMRPRTAPVQKVHRDRGVGMGNRPTPSPTRAQGKKMQAPQVNGGGMPASRHINLRPLEKTGVAEPQTSNGVTTFPTFNEAVGTPGSGREHAQTVHAREPSTPVRQSPVTQAPKKAINYIASLPSPDFDQFDFQWQFLMESLASDIADNDEGHGVQKSTALLPPSQSRSAQPIQGQEHTGPVQEAQAPRTAP